MNCDPVSVIIPTYNRARCIENAIDSVLTQTHQTVDVIVIDDGSTDDTEERITHRFGDEPRVRYPRQQNQAVAAARNRGIAIARADCIAFLDSDDIWKPW